jgi:hypothetical protein
LQDASFILLFTAAYAVAVRGSEYDLPPEMLDDLVAQTTARFNMGDGLRRERDEGYGEGNQV